MKKRLIILTVVLLVCAMALTLVACQEKDENGRIILKAPKDVAISGDTLSWSAVENASGYIVRNGEAIIADSIDKNKNTFSVPADIESGSFSVAAKGDGVTYADGKFSAAVEFKRQGQLTAPKNLQIDYNTKILSWDAIETAASYKVYLKVQGSAVSEESVKDATANNFDLSTLSDTPQIYEISVSAVSATENVRDSGRSGIKNYVVSKTLSAPGTFEFSGTNYLKWGGVDNATKYRIEVYKDGSDAPNSYYEPSGTTTAVSNLKIEDAGKYVLKIKAIGTSSGTYKDSDYCATEIEVVKLSAPAGAAFDGTTVTWNTYSDSNSQSEDIKLSVIFKSGSNTTFEKKLDSAALTQLTVADVTELVSESNIGKIYDIYVKATGNGTTILDSVETKIDYRQGYLSYDKELTENADGYYEIANAGDLGFAVFNPDKNYKLTADIDLASADWRAMPELKSGFVFDGNGFAIRNFNLGNREIDNARHLGLFTKVASGAVVKNLAVLNVKIKGGDKAGIITAENYGTIENCTVSGEIIGSGSAGGIASLNAGNVKYCFSNTHIIAGNAGGIAAWNKEGSIVGCGAYNAISSSMVDGDVLYVGGLVGYNFKGKISDSFAEVAVGGNGSGNQIKVYCGGFVGYTDGEITNCYATKNFSALAVGGSGTAAYSGGFAGFNGGKIKDAYAVGSMTTDNNAVSGGFIGLNKGTIENAFARGSVVGSKNRSGAFAGDNQATLVNAYHQKDVNYNACAANSGTGVVTTLERAELRTQQTAEKLGSAFVYHGLSQSKYPVLKAMMYHGESESVSVSQNKDVSYTFKNVYFGGEEVEPTKTPSTSVKGDFVAEYVKTAGDKTYKLIKYFTVK